MRMSRSLLFAALLPGAVALAPRAAPASATAPAADTLIEAVRAAPGPSAAIEAYARGVAAGTVAPVELERAFVQHMVSHGAPELADEQAHDLVNRGAGDAIARGVAAYNDAARGNVRAAVGNLQLALIGRPNDPFVLRTAGQIVAWYDSRADRSGLSKEDVTGIEWLRTAGKQRQEFADAYATVSEALHSAPAAVGPSTAAPTTQSSSVDAPAAANYGGGSTSYSFYYGYGTYSPYDYPYYGYGYGSGYSAIVLRDGDFHRDLGAPRFNRRYPPGRAGTLRDGSPVPGRVGPGGATPQGTGRPPRPQGGPPQPPPRPPLPPGPPPHP